MGIDDTMDEDDVDTAGVTIGRELETVAAKICVSATTFGGALTARSWCAGPGVIEGS